MARLSWPHPSAPRLRGSDRGFKRCCIVLYICIDVSSFVTLMLARVLRPLEMKRIWGSGNHTHIAEHGTDLSSHLREF